MVLWCREPFRELRQMQENMDRLWRSFGHEGGEAGNAENYEYGILSITGSVAKTGGHGRGVIGALD